MKRLEFQMEADQILRTTSDAKLATILTEPEGQELAVLVHAAHQVIGANGPRLKSWQEAEPRSVEWNWKWTAWADQVLGQHERIASGLRFYAGPEDLVQKVLERLMGFAGIATAPDPSGSPYWPKIASGYASPWRPRGFVGPSDVRGLRSMCTLDDWLLWVDGQYTAKRF